ncbi:MAG TPA: SDR family oxidoreductase [Abditibacteriaceae bacterium]|nr:SDR family oxidoreductase [Abditibacteriaceae bacterium]
MLLDKKTIIVTGAGGGLGEGIARTCHREGANVVIADVRREAAEAVARSLGERALAVACDVSKDAALRRLVDKAVRKFGRLDGLVNNAGINFARPFLETTAADWERVISVDLRAVFFLSQLACRQMLEQTPPGGSIVNISSVHSYAALPGAGPYDAAKWGVVGLGKSIAVEFADKNIRVNMISPGLLNTNIWQDVQAAAPDAKSCMEYWASNIPLGRVIEPGEIGELAAFLLSDRNTCITGANIFADGGMTSLVVSKEPYQSKPMTGE